MSEIGIIAGVGGIICLGFSIVFPFVVVDFKSEVEGERGVFSVLIFVGFLTTSVVIGVDVVGLIDCSCGLTLIGDDTIGLTFSETNLKDF